MATVSFLAALLPRPTRHVPVKFGSAKSGGLTPSLYTYMEREGGARDSEQEIERERERERESRSERGRER